MLSPAGTRSPLTTPPVLLVSDHVAGTFATKLPPASREIAKTVIELPDATLCAPTTDPEPSTAVSTRMAVAAPADTSMVPLVPVSPSLSVAVTVIFTAASVLTVNETVALPVASVSDVGVAKLPPVAPPAQAPALHSFDQTIVLPACGTLAFVPSRSCAVMMTELPSAGVDDDEVTR